MEFTYVTFEHNPSKPYITIVKARSTIIGPLLTL